MADSLKFANDSLLICNYALALTCCSSGQYWDGIICDDELSVNKYCVDLDRCNFNNRIFLHSDSYCDQKFRVPECQRLLVDHLPSLVTGVYDNGLQITVSSAPATINWSDTNITLQAPSNGTTVLTNSGSLTSLILAINSVLGWGAANTDISFTSIGTIIAPTSYTFPSIGSKYLATKRSSLDFSYGSNAETKTAYLHGDRNVFRSELHDKINQLSSITGQVIVVYNSNYQDPLNTDVSAFEMVFSGTTSEGLPAAGTRKNNLIIKDHLVYANYSDDGLNEVKYGDYTAGMGWRNTGENYLRIGSGLYDNTTATVGNLCPMESPQFSSSGSLTGPYPYSFREINCCPQRGHIIGSGQNIGYSEDGTQGYEVNQSDFSNLENTIYHNGSCYQLSPFYFLSGKNGKFSRDQFNTRKLFTEPDCNVGSCTVDDIIVPSVASGEYIPPGNCSLDLFLPQFSHELPWGPFGGYYSGVERAFHISANIGNPPAWEYKPSGWIRTVGEWTNTKYVEITVGYYKQVPFYMGLSPSNPYPDRYGGCIYFGGAATGFDPTSTGVAIIANTGINRHRIIIPTTGRTVQDFLNIVNNITTLETDYHPACKVFAFCGGGDYLANIPMSKIINISSELYDIAKIYNSYDPTYGTTRPDLDLEPDLVLTGDGNEGPFSGSDIFYPSRYSDMWPKYVSDTIVPAKLSVSQPDDNNYTRGFKPPPECRHRIFDLPKESGIGPTTNFRKKAGQSIENGITSPWWQSIPGSYETVINITKNAIGHGIDALDVYVQDRKIWVLASSGGNVVASGNVNTNKNGFHYPLNSGVADLNALNLVYGGFTTTIRATGTSIPYDIWLDDSSYWDSTTYLPVNSGGVGAVETPYNWSYREPLFDTPVTSIYNTQTAHLKSFIRRRCNWQNGDVTEDLSLDPCIPEGATKVNAGQVVLCQNENVYDGNLIVSYGCLSRHCKTQWYIQASRCGCSTTYDCTTETNRSHLFNHDGDRSTNTDRWSERLLSEAIIEDEYHVNQPILYLCKQNIYPTCDIPFLIKVPYQAVGSTTGMFYNYLQDQGPYDSRFKSCENDEQLDIYYADGSAFPLTPEALIFFNGLSSWDKGLMDCGESHTPALLQGILSSNSNLVFCNDCDGWCQYIDPENPTLVAYEDIPRTWPPTAYTMARGIPSMCSTNLYNTSISEICSPTETPDPCGWDKLIGLHPHLPYNKYDSDGIACMYIEPTDKLTALLRPMINNFDVDDLCGGGVNSTRLDINCSTKCCKCFFSCDQLVSYPCTQLFTLEQEVIIHDFTWCGTSFWYDNLAVSFVCRYSNCSDSVGGNYSQPHSLNSLYSEKIITNATYQSHTCGCKPTRITGEANYQYNIIETFPCADGSPDYWSTPICPPDGTQCQAECLPDNYIAPFTCDQADYISEFRSGVTDVSSTSCAGPLSCPTPHGRDTRTLVTESSQSSLDGFCFARTESWNEQITHDFGGTSDPCGINGYFGGAGEIYNGSFINSRIGSLNAGPVMCGSCNGGSQTSQTLPYVTGWYQSNQFACGMPNIFRSNVLDLNYYSVNDDCGV